MQRDKSAVTTRRIDKSTFPAADDPMHKRGDYEIRSVIGTPLLLRHVRHPLGHIPGKNKIATPTLARVKQNAQECPKKDVHSRRGRPSIVFASCVRADAVD
jgi:hypothetical protein